MANIFEATYNALKLSMDNEPKSPVHIGEAYACWMYVALMTEASTFMQMANNMTTDDELKEMLNDSIKQCEKHSKEITTFMRKEGIHLPNTSEPRPNSDPNSVPLGTKMTDEEIANGVSIKTVTAIVHCATSAAQSIRNDVGMMWIEFLNGKMLFGQSLKTMMRERGWIKVPPYYYPPGMPHHKK